MAHSDDWLKDVALLMEVDLSIGTRWDGSVPAGTFAIFVDGRSKKRQHTLIQLIRGTVPQDDDIAEEHNRGFQVLVTGDKQNAGPAILKAEEIYDKLHTQVALTPTGGSRTFAVFMAQQAPTLIGKDENQNIQYSFNFLTKYREEVS